MITRVIPWTIEIAALNTRLRVGIWDHEREPQAIQIHLSIRAIAPVLPQAIDDCLDYQPICHWIVNVWPEQAHALLLETKMSELLAFVFNFDARIEWVDAAICKPLPLPKRAQSASEWHSHAGSMKRHSSQQGGWNDNERLAKRCLILRISDICRWSAAVNNPFAGKSQGRSRLIHVGRAKPSAHIAMNKSHAGLPSWQKQEAPGGLNRHSALFERLCGTAPGARSAWVGSEGVSRATFAGHCGALAKIAAARHTAAVITNRTPYARTHQ